MKRKNEKVPGFDEIIFENRNKEYGAYDLRRRYLPATLWSILGGVAVFILLAIVLSLSMEKPVTAVVSDPFIIVVRVDSALINLNRIKPPEPVIPKIEIPQERYLPPVVVDKVDSSDNGLLAVVSLDSVKNPPVDKLTTSVINTDEIVPSNQEPLNIFNVQEKPEFPGGEMALLKFISETIKYPQEALNNNLEGKVILQFVVSSDGMVSRTEIIRGIHPVLDQEAVRVISILPRWKPAKQNGKPVPVWFTIPVTFKLKRD